ncbi:hypothetical protein B0T21DRAFT_380396 [Apiosordaria backusii]|uniref:T6SS Phospholipase effector Tle1-like catalytic domain-containing protein n=1 Tax=Apiosordaria backusii TaxID=314023 RepID=A0AA40K7T6_9PEZI|nr:hypothetical protein B0T21DRAFT_380396 [Apiosordaria backusii]
MSLTSQPIQITKKRLVVCCDGTWMNCDTGYRKSSYRNPVGKAIVPSNVSRLSRSLRRSCTDGTLQVIEYHSGIGSSGSFADVLSGGAFSLGISENIRSSYSFICANYTDGDEIILVGFSRGAFTARSVAGMISDIGLLTREGMEYFYPIFKDMHHWRDKKYHDPFPDIPFGDKPKGEDAPRKYRDMLVERSLTRAHQNQEKGPLIKVRAVGSLGIPNTTLFAKLGLPHSTSEYHFYDTDLSDRIEYAFHALALDEHRPAFAPTVWERTSNNWDATDLRQVWFPGNHGNIGGGWKDAGISDMSLAWMMDQLASIGVQFDEAVIMRLFDHLEHSYRDMAEKDSKFAHGRKRSRPPSEATVENGTPQEETSMIPEWLRTHLPKATEIGKKIIGEKHWAIEPICESNLPLRPWALGALRGASKGYHKLVGSNIRSPCTYKKRDTITGKETDEFLEDTNERVHSSVRVRLALQGLGLNDKDIWEASALKGKWAVRKTTQEFVDPIPKAVASWERPAVAAAGPPSAATTSWKRKLGLFNKTATKQDDDGSIATSNAATLVDTAVEQQRPLHAMDNKGYRWVWEYCGKEKDAPPQRVMVEEPLGPFERQLLRLSGGVPNIYEFAETVEGIDGRKV